MKKITILLSIFLLSSCFTWNSEIENMVKDLGKTADISFYQERLEQAQKDIETKIELIKNSEIANFEVCEALQIFEEFKEQGFLNSVGKTENGEIIYDNSKIENKVEIKSVRASDSECMVTYYQNGEKIKEKIVKFKDFDFTFMDDFEKYLNDYQNIYNNLEEKGLQFIQESVEKMKGTEISIDEVKNILSQ